jgi:hypothetical protein
MRERLGLLLGQKDKYNYQSTTVCISDWDILSENNMDVRKLIIGSCQKGPYYAPCQVNG